MFWAGLRQRRGKSRKPYRCLLGAGGLAGKHSDVSVTMALGDGGQKVSGPTRMGVRGAADDRGGKGKVTPASLPPSS